MGNAALQLALRKVKRTTRLQRYALGLKRSKEALDLYAASYSYTEIADKLGYANRGSAWKAVQRAMKRTHGEIMEKVAEIRELQHARLERAIRLIDEDLQAVDLPKMQADFDKGMDNGMSPAKLAVLLDGITGLRQRRFQAAYLLKNLCERQAKLLGLDAPSKVDANLNTASGPALMAAAMHELADEEIQEAEAVVVDSTPLLGSSITNLGEKGDDGE